MAISSFLILKIKQVCLSVFQVKNKFSFKLTQHMSKGIGIPEKKDVVMSEKYSKQLYDNEPTT